MKKAVPQDKFSRMVIPFTARSIPEKKSPTMHPPSHPSSRMSTMRNPAGSTIIISPSASSRMRSVFPTISAWSFSPKNSLDSISLSALHFPRTSPRNIICSSIISPKKWQKRFLKKNKRRRSLVCVCFLSLIYYLRRNLWNTFLPLRTTAPALSVSAST